MPPGMVGMMVTYGIALTGRMNHLVRQSLETEQDFSSVERILEYTNLVSEDVNTQTGVEIITHDATLQRSLSLSKKTKTWPHSGAIEFKNISVRYRKGLDLVIRNFSASIRAKEKIGICGRTGAGKSSLLSLLFR
jgi:ABC-type multidrug transport system fused ATPase/permease subunit